MGKYGASNSVTKTVKVVEEVSLWNLSIIYSNESSPGKPVVVDDKVKIYGALKYDYGAGIGWQPAPSVEVTLYRDGVFHSSTITDYAGAYSFEVDMKEIGAFKFKAKATPYAPPPLE